MALRVSACTASYGHESLARVIDRLAELGYDGAEITVMYHLPPDETSMDDLRRVRGLLDDAGIAASALHFIFPAGLSFVSAEADDRAAVARQIGRTAEMAAELGAEVVMVGGGGIRSIPRDMSREEGTRRVMEVFATAAEQAAACEVALAFEALNRYETNIGNGVAEVAELVSSVGSQYLGVGADTFHMNIEEADLGAALSAVADRLAHVHLADSHRLAPGDGHVDFASVLESLEASGYGGWVSMELFAIAPNLFYLPTWDACDREVSRAIEHVRAVQAAKGAAR